MDREKLLGELQKQELDRLESKRLELTEKTYPQLPDMMRQTSQITGISEEVLVLSCVRAARHYEGLEWHDLLRIIKSIFLAKKQIEEES